MKPEFGNPDHIRMLEHGVKLAQAIESGKAVKIKQIEDVEECEECGGSGEIDDSRFECPECENSEYLKSWLYTVIDGDARCKQCLVKFNL